MDEHEQRVGKKVDVRHGGEGPGEDAENEQRRADPEYGLVAEAVGDFAPVGDGEVGGQLAERGQPDDDDQVQLHALEHVHGERTARRG